MDDSQEGGIGKPHCMVLLGLMRKNCRCRKRIGHGTLSIRYAVYKVLGAGSLFTAHWMSLVGRCWPGIGVHLSCHLNGPHQALFLPPECLSHWPSGGLNSTIRDSFLWLTFLLLIFRREIP